MSTSSIHPARVSVKVSARLQRNLLSVVVVGIAITIVGLVVAPERAWPNILLANYYMLSLGLAGIIFIALQYVSNAGWATAIRRVPEAMAGTLPVPAVIMLAILFGVHTLYEWSHPSVVATDALLQAKSGWLNVPFFSIRTAFYVALWTAFAFAIIKRSRAQDSDGNIQHTLSNRKLSAAFILVFGITFTVASMDWIMSLQPHWYSTIFGIYNMCGLFLNGLATMTVIVILLRQWGPLTRIVTESHLHDLGKLVFAFSTFWMYIWFSQYILIWYANIPEEVRFYTARERGGWLLFTILNVVFNWFIPFLALLPIWAKKNEGVLLRVCLLIMLAHWVDLFWMILPPFMPASPVVFVWELGPIAAAIAGFFLMTFRAMAKHNLLPVKDPYLVESVAQQQ